MPSSLHRPWVARVAPAPAARLLLACLTAAALPARAATAQTAQRLSVQGSAIVTKLFGDGFETMTAGPGVEAQLRYTRGATSFGAGFQYTRHGDTEAEADGHDANIGLLGIFFEPRYVISTGSSRAAPYLSARLGFAQFDVRVNFSDGDVITFTSNGVTANGGGGVLVSLTPRVNLDAGATFGYSGYRDVSADISGRPFEQEMGSGLNVVLRLGLAIGLGR